MVASIGAIASPAQGAGYFERDGYYTKDDPAHREASAWAGKGAEALGLSGPVDSDTFKVILEGKVPDGPHLGKRGKDGEIHHRPGRDVTMSAPKSVSLMAMIGGDERIVAAHDRAVKTTLGWIEKNAILTRMQDPGTSPGQARTTGAMIHAGDQKTVVATFRHDTSRNLDPQLHTHCVIANMVQGGDGKWRTMVNDGLYRQQKAISAIYRAELAEGLARLGYGIERTHADGRFEIEGVPRETIEAFSTRRAEIEAAMKARGFDDPADNKRIADRAALMTRAAKRDVDKGTLRQVWEKQAAALGFSPERVLDGAREREPETSTWGAASRGSILAGNEYFVTDAVNWAVEHLSERQAVFSQADLLAAALSYEPGSATVGEAEWTVEALERDGRLHGAIGPEHGRHWATEAAVAREWETVGLMRAGKDAGERVMRRWVATTKLHRGRLNEGQKEAVRTVLSTKDRVVGVQGYAGTGKTAMLDRFRVLAESAGYRVAGLAPSASAARTLGQESGIRSETLQRFLARHAGFAEGRGTARSLRDMRKTHAKTILVVDESSLASSEQMRGLLRIAAALRLLRVVLVGDEKQLDGVEAGKPFAQLQRAGMTTATMDEILRQRDTELKEAVRASLAGEVKTAFAKLGDRVAQAEPDNLGQEAAKRWLSLSPEQRETAGVIAPTRALRDTINEAIRERLIAEGAVHGPAWETRKLVPRGLTNAEMTRTANYEAGDTVIFNRRYKTLGVDKGDAREVARVDSGTRTVHLRDDRGGIVEWKPVRIAAAKGGLEVYRSETTELRAGDRVRFARNDPASGLTNGQVAEVETVEKDGVRFRLEDGSLTRLGESDPMLRHLDRAWAATVHAFQGRTVDRIVAAMPAGNAALVNQKSLYVAISRARDRADLITDDPKRLADHLQQATGERIAALDGVARHAGMEAAKQAELPVERHGGHAWDAGDAVDRGRQAEIKLDRAEGRERRSGPEAGHGREQKSSDRSRDRGKSVRDSSERDRERGGERGDLGQRARQSEQEKTPEPKQKSRDLDLGL